MYIYKLVFISKGGSVFTPEKRLVIGDKQLRLIKEAMMRSRLTQGNLAELAGVQQGWLSGVLSGNRKGMTGSSWVKLSEVFKRVLRETNDTNTQEFIVSLENAFNDVTEQSYVVGARIFGELVEQGYEINQILDIAGYLIGNAEAAKKMEERMKK
jgi:transcriptional regulator with XRE-family HTH domain